MPSRRSLTHESGGSDFQLIFHAPLTSNVNDIITSLSGTLYNGSWDSYASTRGIKVSSVRYYSNVYWDISALRTLLSSASSIKIQATVYLTSFYYTSIPNANNYTTTNIISTPSAYSSASMFSMLRWSGNDSATAFTSLNTQNVIQATYYNITDTYYDVLSENLTRDTSTISSNSSSTLRAIINTCDYLQFCNRMWHSGGAFSGYVKDLKIWVK